MKKRNKVNSNQEHILWMPMTDMLASTLMITFLFIAVSTIVRAMNAKPPVIKLEDTADYRFGTGSFLLSRSFKASLHDRAIPQIKNTIKCYGIDTIEIIGHTDGRPGGSFSNLDKMIGQAAKTSELEKLIAGSNIDLGFLRGMSVKSEIQSALNKSGLNTLGYRVLSAGSTISPNGIFLPGRKIDEKSRRRIEIRFLRISQKPFIPRCS
jgi:hypothetical protein